MRAWSRCVVVVLAGALLAGSALAQEREGREPRRSADREAPKVGDTAPLFTLKTLDGKREVSLDSFRGKRPVMVIFGSYT